MNGASSGTFSGYGFGPFFDYDCLECIAVDNEQFIPGTTTYDVAVSGWNVPTIQGALTPTEVN